MSIETNITRIIAIGSHHGIDQLGWAVCEQLSKEQWQANLDWQLCRTPAQLPELLSGIDKVILIDTLLNDRPVGTLQLLDHKQIADNQHNSHSSHGLGVYEALEITNSLDQLPDELTVLGISVNQDSELSANLINSIATNLKTKLNELT